MGMKINPRKFFWVRPEVEYLGYMINREDIRQQQKKIQGMLDLQAPRNQKELRGFIGMINFYKNMWAKCASILALLTSMTGKGTKFKWMPNHQLAFDQMKTIMSRETLLAFPDFIK